MERSVRGRFVAASAGLHLLLAALSVMFVNAPGYKTPDIVRVHILPDAAPPVNADFPDGKLLDAQRPEKLIEEHPDGPAALAAFDARANTPAVMEKPRSAAHSGPEELNIGVPRKESQRRKREADTPKSDSEKKTAVAENPFSPVPMAATKSDQPGQPAKSNAAENGMKPDRETKEQVRTLSGAEIDGFAAANPAGTLETANEIVIPLNTRRFAYFEYFTGIKRGVENTWAYPYEAMNSGAGGSTVLRFTLLRSGGLEEVRVISTAGMAVLDNAAVVAVKNAAPFAPFPAGLDKEKIHIVATFTYQSSFGKVP